jgi:hypothetical protein
MLLNIEKIGIGEVNGVDNIVVQKHRASEYRTDIHFFRRPGLLPFFEYNVIRRGWYLW